MRCFVTGGGGFLGKFLVQSLLADGYEVVAPSSKEADLTQPQSLKPWDDVVFDRIYHLAAWTQAGDFCLKHPAEQWLINQAIHTHVLDWWQKRQRKAKMIAIGTSCSYDPHLPLEEKNYLKGEPIEGLFTYAMTKRMLLAGLIAMKKQWDMNYLYLVPSTLYGEGYHSDGRQMHFIFDLIRKILRGKWFQEPVTLWGDGLQKREIFHVRDFVKILRRSENTLSNMTLNVGSGEEHSIRFFAEKICDQVGYSFEKILFDQDRYVGARSKVLDVKKMRQAFPNFEATPLETGIREVVHWFEETQFVSA